MQSGWLFRTRLQHLQINEADIDIGSRRIFYRGEAARRRNATTSARRGSSLVKRVLSPRDVCLAINIRQRALITIPPLGKTTMVIATFLRPRLTAGRARLSHDGRRLTDPAANIHGVDSIGRTCRGRKSPTSGYRASGHRRSAHC